MIKKYLIVSLAAFLSVVYISTATAKPKPISSPKVGTGKPLKYIKSFPEAPPRPGSDYYQGKLYKAGKINVVVLEGTYEEMGRQYGALLKDELNANYQGIIEALKKIPGITFEEIQESGNMIYGTSPEKYQKIINGLAETSGLGLKKAKFLFSQEDYVFKGLLAMVKGENISGSSHCSGIAAWGDYTGGKALVFGRNYDLGPVNHEYAALIVYNPIDGSLPTASFTYAGSVYVTSGMNRNGLFLELNNGSTSDKGDFTGLRTLAPVSLFNFLEQSKNLSELDTFFNTVLPDLSYIINAADKDYSYSYEWPTTGAKKRNPDKKGLMVATNIFFDPSWGKQNYDVAKDPDFIVKRRDNLVSLAEKYKGKLDPEKMMEVIAVPLEKGGAFRAPNLTSYQLVAEPESLKMWLRIPEYQDWVEVDLAQFFNKN